MAHEIYVISSPDAFKARPMKIYYYYYYFLSILPLLTNISSHSCAHFCSELIVPLSQSVSTAKVIHLQG